MSRFPCWATVGFLAFSPCFFCAAASAQYPAQPERPRVNMAPWYEVDAAWPTRSDSLPWGGMPGIAIDRDDHVWIFTRAETPVQQYDKNGKLLRSWGKGLIQTAHSIRVDPKGNIWLSDVGRHVVYQCSPEGKVLRTLGTLDQPGEDATHFNKPTDTAITPQGDVYVADGYGNNRIVQFDSQGKFVRAWGKFGTKPGEFNLPHAIVVDSKGRLYVADRANVRVQVFAADGKFLAEWRNLIVPWGLKITAHDEIWVCGSSPMPWRKDDKHLSCPPKDQLVLRLDTAGAVKQVWTIPYNAHTGHEAPGEVNWLHGIEVDQQGNLYVSDIMGKRAQKLLRRD